MNDSSGPPDANPAHGGSTIFAPGMLSGRVALVTGGGTGLGKATALELARCGASVTIAGRRAEMLEQAAAEIGELTGAHVESLAGDVRDAADARRLIDDVLERGQRLDVLVNNAGGQFFSPAELIAAKGWRAVWRLNVEGMLNMAEAAYERAFRTRAASPAGGDSARRGERHEAQRARGAQARASAAATVVNVTLSPHHGMPGMAHSGAARATVEALTRELAQRWAASGVAVVAVAAGTFDTEVMVKYPTTVRAGMSRSVPLQRMGTVAEHAWLVALLATPLGSSLSGSTVTLDGARDNWFGPWPPPGLLDESGEVPVEERR